MPWCQYKCTLTTSNTQLEYRMHMICSSRSQARQFNHVDPQLTTRACHVIRTGVDSMAAADNNGPRSACCDLLDTCYTLIRTSRMRKVMHSLCIPLAHAALKIEVYSSDFHVPSRIRRIRQWHRLGSTAGPNGQEYAGMILRFLRQ